MIYLIEYGTDIKMQNRNKYTCKQNKFDEFSNQEIISLVGMVIL